MRVQRPPQVVMGYQSMVRGRASAVAEPERTPLAVVDNRRGEPTYVYRFYDRDRALLYVGVTKAPKERFSQHAATKAWWGEVDRRELRLCASRTEALRREARAIREEEPRHNIVVPALWVMDQLVDQVNRQRSGEVAAPSWTLLDPEELVRLLNRQTKRHFKMPADVFVEAYRNGDIDRDDERLRFVANLIGAQDWIAGVEERSR